MNVAVIEKNREFFDALNVRAKTLEWSLDQFNTPFDFGKADLSKYDVILTGQFHPDMSGKYLIDTLHNKTSAVFAIMADDASTFDDEEISSEQVNGLVEKSDIDQVIDWLKYAEVKMNVRKNMEHEQQVFSTMHAVTNGYCTDVIDGVLTVGISKPLHKLSRIKIVHLFEDYDYKGVVYFTDKVKTVQSAHLNQLVILWKEIVSKRGGQLVFIMNENDLHLRNVMEQCGLSKLYRTANTTKDAIEHFKSKQEA